MDAAIEDLKMAPWDLEEVRELFISLEFRTLLERLMAEGHKQEEAALVQSARVFAERSPTTFAAGTEPLTTW